MRVISCILTKIKGIPSTYHLSPVPKGAGRFIVHSQVEAEDLNTPQHNCIVKILIFKSKLRRPFSFGKTRNIAESILDGGIEKFGQKERN